MAGGGRKCLLVVVMVAAFGLLLAVTLGSAERIFLDGDNAKSETETIVDPVEGNTLKYHVLKAGNFLWQSNKTEYHRVWPAMKFGWRIVLGTIVGFFGAAVGSVGGVGGGGIFVPMLTLIIGFDAKSSTAISKCMIMGAAGSTVYYNLKLKHPTLDLPIIDYDLAMLFQPMLMLGISIGVAFNVIFADWMVTILLIILFLGTSTKAFLKGVETWKQETILKKVLDFFYNILFKVRTKRDLNLVTGVTLGSLILGAFNPCCKDLIDYIGPTQEAERLRVENITADVEPEEHQEVDFKPLPSEPVPNEESNGNNEGSRNVRLPTDVTNTIWINVRWKELGILVLVWIAFLVLQIFKTKSTTCSVEYWALNLLQIPVAMSVSLYEAVGLYRGTKSVASKGEAGINWKISQLLLYFFCGILAGVVGGLLGLGGGFILGPLLLELGVPPQVSSATATFVMTFSSSMSVVEYYFLKRFPVPYAAYLFGVCVIAAFMGQHVIRRLVILLGRASLIIFILAFVIFLSALTLGGVGIVKMIHEIENGDYMGFESLCSYTA